MAVERRDCIIPVETLNNSSNEEELMTETKPFGISKHVVFEAYKRVKANKGAAGVTGQGAYGQPVDTALHRKMVEGVC